VNLAQTVDDVPFRPCIIIPFYRHEQAIAFTVQRLKPFGLRCWIVDDGSGEQSQAVLQKIAHHESSWVTLYGYPLNQGKGVAFMTGCSIARSADFTHALQIDADGQHDARDIPRLLALAQQYPKSLVTGVPIFDDSVPKQRLYGRYLTHFCVWIQTLSFEIRDSMCGFRVYPLDSTLAVWKAGGVGRRMDFDTEIMVRMYWRGVRVRNLPTPVTYPQNGVSHYDMLRDNLRMINMHVRLLVGMVLRLPRLLWWHVRRPNE
jgi:glycosyltransferase involved in cell wall biosynthesis